MTGTVAPRTSPAPSAWLTKASCLASMLPASIPGTTRMLARPATPPVSPLVRAAPMSTALSMASGPSTWPPRIWPRSAILDRSAASIEDWIAGVTVSTADRTPTRGSIPRDSARSMAFWQMSTLVGRSGAMLIAASVTNRGSGRPGTSMTKTCVSRRPARRPRVLSSTARSRSSVCRWPFITAATRPSCTSAQARSAAAASPGTSTIAIPVRSSPIACAAARIAPASPTSTGVMIPSRSARSAPPSDLASVGQTTAVASAGSGRERSMIASKWRWRWTISPGTSTPSRSTGCSGAVTSASPVRIGRPSAWRISVRSRTRPSALDRTSARTITSSPAWARPSNASVWRR